MCESWEDSDSCSDCYCGDGVCSDDEDRDSCRRDCDNGGPRCGDGTCDDNEDATSCSRDCRSDSAECGDGTCDDDEDATSCSADCDAGSVCGDGTCDDDENTTSCPEDCTAATECGDGTCDDDEDATSCPADCNAGSVCGDGTCDDDEDATSCPEDCASATECGDGTAEGDEECDGADLAGADCQSRGFDAGSLVCTTSCELDESGCVNVAAPSGLTYTEMSATYEVGVAIADNTPGLATGDAPITYTVTPALPQGLALDASTGVVSGTPEAVASEATYTVKAENAGGDTTADLSIAVTPPFAWFCDPAVFGDGVDCDCGCGTADPDCEADPTADTGCPGVGTQCDPVDGLCLVHTCADDDTCVDCASEAGEPGCERVAADQTQCAGAVYAGFAPDLLIPPFTLGYCQVPSVGATDNGDGCTSHDQCSSGYCIHGMCSPWCGVDGDCPSSLPCAEGLVPLYEGALAPQLGFGRMCLPTALGASCTKQSDCAGNDECRLFFDTLSQPAYHCLAPTEAGPAPGVGEACTGQNCALGLVCHDDACRLPCPGDECDGGTCTTVTLSHSLTSTTEDDYEVDLCITP